MAQADADPPSISASPPRDALTRGFLFADLRGYTSFVESQGATAGAELLHRYRALVRGSVARHDGAEIKTEGDSFYVVFSSVSRAVECGLGIVEAAAVATDDHPDQPIRPGIGVHAGETVETPEGYVGSAVNMAARLCSAAGPGEVFVSETVRALTANSSPLHYQLIGRRKLKGIVEPVAVYRALPANVTARASVTRTRRWVALAGSVIVVAAAVAALTRLPALFAEADTSPRAAASSGGTASSTGATSGQADTVAIVIPSFDPDSGPPAPFVLEAGIRYQFTRFRPLTSLTVPDDTWRVTHDDPDGFELTRRPSPDEFQGYLAGAYVQVVNVEPCIDSETELIDPTARALIEWLQDNSYVEVTTPRPMNISGMAGLSVEVQQRSPPQGCDEYAPDADKVFMFPLGETSFWLGPDERIRIIVVDLHERPVTFFAGTLDPSSFDDFIVSADAVIQSMQIEP